MIEVGILEKTETPELTEVPLTRFVGYFLRLGTIMSRATDNQGHIQPQTAVWNPSGYLYNAIDQVDIHVRD